MGMICRDLGDAHLYDARRPCPLQPLGVACSRAELEVEFIVNEPLEILQSHEDGFSRSMWVARLQT